MEFIDNNDIENFTKDGAILCRGIFSDWVDKLRIGVDKLILKFLNPNRRASQLSKVYLLKIKA